MGKELKPSAEGAPTDGNVRPLALRAMFWRPDWLVDSTWLEHLPFLMWLVEAQRPRVVVELGTDDGASYFAMCQAVDRLALDTRCFSIRDPLRRDGQWPRVAEQAESFHQDRYAAFSRLLAQDPEQAATAFTAGSVDLLVVDALALGDRTRRVIDAWMPCLADDAVLIVNGTAVPGTGSGIWPAVLQDAHRFEFFHGEGLVCSSAAQEVAPMVAELLRSAQDGNARKSLHEVFARLGRACADNRMASAQRDRALKLEGELDATVAELERVRGGATSSEPAASSETVRAALERAERAEATLARLGDIDPAEVERLRRAQASADERHTLLLRLRADADRKAEAELAAAREDAQASKAEAEALAGQLAAARDEALASKAEAEALAGQLVAARDEALASKAEAEALADKLAVARDEALASKAEAEALAGKLAEARDETLASIAEVGVLAGKVAAAEASLAEKEREAASHRNRLTEMEAEAAARLAEAAEYVRRGAALEQAGSVRVAELEASLAQQEAAAAESSEALAQARGELQEAREKLLALESTVAGQRRTIAQRDARVASLQRERDEAAAMASKASELAREREVLLATAKREHVTVDAERDELRHERDRLRGERDALAREQRALAASLQARFEELSRMARMNSELETRMESAARDAAARLAESEAERRRIASALDTERGARQALELSRVWRITAPARRTGQWVRDHVVRAPSSRGSAHVAVPALDGNAALLRESGLFDAEWYRAQLPAGIASDDSAEEHYLREGAARGLDPSPSFSTTGYLRANPDVEASGLNPLVHYIAHGRSEGRPTR